MDTTFVICGFSFAAGVIDSIAGGGGLIQVPALLLMYPGTGVTTLLGTNKMAGIAGTLTATIRYAHTAPIVWRSILPAAISGFLFSFLGAQMSSQINNSFFYPMLIILLSIVAIYMWRKKDFGSEPARKVDDGIEQWRALLIGTVVGFWDGLVGPGTGSFLIVLFIGVLGYSSQEAACSARIVNLAMNLSALIYFVSAGHIIYAVAVPMSVCNAAGAAIGSKLAIEKGGRFLRRMMLIVVCSMLIKALITK